jgi:hypothetical protein
LFAGVIPRYVGAVLFDREGAMMQVKSSFCWLAGILVSAIACADGHHPDVRGRPTIAGRPFANLASDKQTYFDTGLGQFAETGGIGAGLGPSFNLDSCAGCHQQPAMSGSSPAVNRQ